MTLWSLGVSDCRPGQASSSPVSFSTGGHRRSASSALRLELAIPQDRPKERTYSWNRRRRARVILPSANPLIVDVHEFSDKSKGKQDPSSASVSLCFIYQSAQDSQSRSSLLRIKNANNTNCPTKHQSSPVTQGKTYGQEHQDCIVKYVY
jgi:hypothetical protein